VQCRLQEIRKQRFTTPGKLQAVFFSKSLSFLSGAKNPHTLHPTAPSKPFSQLSDLAIPTGLESLP
jgi:hypothetical protein